MPESNRRHAPRHPILFPMKYDVEAGAAAGSTSSGLAVSRNISHKGILMATADKLVVGAPVRVTFHATEQYPDGRVLDGCIVRVSANTQDPDPLWPYMVAVEFDAPDEALEPLLQEIASLQRGWAD